jgi:RimJ/RimL family protein N-acetyltransferase
LQKVAVMIEQQSVRVPEVLVPYTSEHNEKTVGWLNSADIQATFGWRSALSLDAHRRWVQRATDTRIWAILGLAGQHVGNVLLKINERHRSGYFQIYIGEPGARGLGLGERAFLAVLKAAYEEHGLHRVWLHTFAENVRAEALYQKHGFVLEGVEREALWMDDAFVSQRRWSLLVDEWRGSVGAGAQP